PPTKSPTSSASPPEPSPTGAPSAWALPTSSSAAASATASPTSTTGSPARRMRAQSDARYRAPREPLSSRVNQGAHMSRALDTRTAPPTPVTLEDAQSVGALLASSRSAETRRSYASAMRTFTAWCRVWGYPSIPTGPEVVASYIAHRAELVAHSTISGCRRDLRRPSRQRSWRSHRPSRSPTGAPLRRESPGDLTVAPGDSTDDRPDASDHRRDGRSRDRDRQA